MLLIKLLIFCEQSKDRSNISFRTKNFQGDISVESGHVTRVTGFEPEKLKQALFEEALEVYIKKTPEGPSAETKLAISTLAVETAAFLHESLETKTSFSSLAPPPEKALFSDTSLARESDLLVPASAPEALESKVSNSFALRKTINVDLKALSSQSSGGGGDKQGISPIELRFSKGFPEKKVMGRSPECDIVVDSADASRRHCMLTFDGTHLIVKDLGSSNGTFLNNRVVIESKASGNDILQVGATPYLICID